MQEFHINQHSELPILAMELILDGRHDYSKFWDAIQDSTITFTMTNMNTNIVKIANAPCYIKERETDGCTTQYIICYNWKKRDTRDVGTYKGEFTIHFNGNLIGESKTYPSGDLITPIREELVIVIK